jgi:hypothetical protein
MWLFRRTATPAKSNEQEPPQPPKVETIDEQETLKEKLAKIQKKEESTVQPTTNRNALPSLIGGPSNFLNNEHVMQLKRQLPPHPQSNDWLLLYDSAKMGLAITSFCDRVLGRGPTILVIKDTEGHIFGGFGSESWKKSPKYYGNSQCFLFSIKDDTVKIHPAGAYNTNYMYFNYGNQYNPYNGLAMGGTGKFDFFPLALDKNFAKGESRGSLLTYSSPTLLGEDAFEDTFKVESMEVWGFPLTESDRVNLEYDQTIREEKRGVLTEDGNADLYFMQQAGRVGEGTNYKAELNAKRNEKTS